MANVTQMGTWWRASGCGSLSSVWCTNTLDPSIVTSTPTQQHPRRKQKGGQVTGYKLGYTSAKHSAWNYCDLLAVHPGVYPQACTFFFCFFLFTHRSLRSTKGNEPNVVGRLYFCDRRPSVLLGNGTALASLPSSITNPVRGRRSATVATRKNDATTVDVCVYSGDINQAGRTPLIT